MTRTLAERSGELVTSVRFAPLDEISRERGFVGFRIGIKHQMNDYRAAAIYGRGTDAGIQADGRLFVGSVEPSTPKLDLAREILLELYARPFESGYEVLLRASSATDGHTVETRRELPADWLTGGLALVCSSGPVEPPPATLAPIKDFSFYPPHQQRGGNMRFWFADWIIGGSKVEQHDDRAAAEIDPDAWNAFFACPPGIRREIANTAYSTPCRMQAER